MSKSDNSQNITISDSKDVKIGNIKNDVKNTTSLSGDFSNSNVNINSTLSSAAQIAESGAFSEERLVNLEAHLDLMRKALAEIPKDRQEDAEIVAVLVKELVEKASSEKPNRRLIEISSEGLKQATQTLADIAPNVLKIAIQIVRTVMFGL